MRRRRARGRTALLAALLLCGALVVDACSAKGTRRSPPVTGAGPGKAGAARLVISSLDGAPTVAVTITPMSG